MSDNFKRYNCIKSGLRQLFPKGLSAYELKMLDHLAKFINGIIGAGGFVRTGVTRSILERAT